MLADVSWFTPTTNDHIDQSRCNGVLQRCERVFCVLQFVDHSMTASTGGLRQMGHVSTLFCIFFQRKRTFDFLLASLSGKTLPKGGSALREAKGYPI